MKGRAPEEEGGGLNDGVGHGTGYGLAGTGVWTYPKLAYFRRDMAESEWKEFARVRGMSGKTEELVRSVFAVDKSRVEEWLVGDGVGKAEKIFIL